MNKHTGTVHHLCTTGRCGTKHPCVAAMRSRTLPNGYISYLGGCWRSVTFVKMTFIEQDAAFVSFVVAKLRVTQQPKRRLYLELLLEPGSKPWYVVVVVIFSLKKKRKMSRILKDVYENDTFTSVFYRLIIVCPRWCFRVRSQSNGATPRQELPAGFQNKIPLAWLATTPKKSQIL